MRSFTRFTEWQLLLLHIFVLFDAYLLRLFFKRRIAACYSSHDSGNIRLERDEETGKENGDENPKPTVLLRSMTKGNATRNPMAPASWSRLLPNSSSRLANVQGRESDIRRRMTERATCIQ